MKQTKEQFEKIVEVNDYGNLFIGFLNVIATIILIFAIIFSSICRHSFIIGLGLGLNSTLALFNILSYFEKDNRKVYWRRIK
jgi:hypothetical protein